METLIGLAAGAIGGNGAGALFKNLNQGVAVNSIAGIVGGGLGAQVLSMLGGDGMNAMISQVMGGGIGGSVVLAIVAIVRKAINK